jgi:hypothetical protein
MYGNVSKILDGNQKRRKHLIDEGVEGRIILRW